MRTRLRFICLVVTCLGSSPVVQAELNAFADCQAGRVVVANKGSDDWFEVKIEVNRDYVHQTAVIAKGDTMRFFPSIFTKDDGSKLNLSSTSCKSIDIHATVHGKRDHWNGARK